MRLSSRKYKLIFALSFSLLLITSFESFESILLSTILRILVFLILYFLINYEIKRRKESEEKVREKDKTLEKIKDFEFLVDSLPHMIWISDALGNRKFNNNHWYQYTGLSFDESDTKGRNKIIHPDDQDKVNSAWTTALNSGEIFQTEYRLKNKYSDTYNWFSSVASPMKDAKGNILKWFGACTDIQNQKLTEENIRQSSEMYRLLVNSEDYAIYFLNKDGIVNSWNTGAEKIIGYNSEEVIGNHFNIFYPKNSKVLGLPEYELEMAYLKGNFEDNGYRIRKDGSTFWANESISAIYNDNQELLGYSKITRDFTVKRDGEERLKAQNEELSAFRLLAIDEMQKKTQVLNGIISYMSVLILRIDSFGIVTEAIGTRKEIFRKYYDLKGENIFETLYQHKDKLKKAVKGVKQVFIMEEGAEYLEFNLFPDNINNEGIICFVSDISEKRQAEKKIKENEKLFKGLLETAPDAMIIANDSGEIELVNTKTRKLFGYNSDELIGANIEKLLSNRYLNNMDHHREEFNKNLKVQIVGENVELYGKRMDGSDFPAEVNLSPLHLKNGVLISASIRDVTNRKNIEGELMKSRAAALSANSSKSQFLANMSHEIRTPLNAIIGFSEVMAREELDNIQQKEYLQYITSSGNLLLKLIGDILDISKIEEGKLDLIKDSFNFKEVVSSSILPYRFKANENGLDFELIFEGNIPDYLIGDGPRICQIIINLIGNALKFTKEGGINVIITSIAEDPQNEKITLQIDVADSGIGISKDKQVTVFDSFTQADNTILRKFGGSGLGLTIVKKLIGMMEGEIEIISPSNTTTKGGKGTIFRTILDMKIGNRNVSDSIDEPFLNKTYNESHHILVVEDNIVNQRLAKVILRKFVGNTDFASNGKEAIELVKNKKYSLIFMDIQMPEMDGMEATRIIKYELNSPVPIIGLTANVFKEDIDNCLNAGMDGYLGKPYTEEQIYNILNKWIKPVITI